MNYFLLEVKSVYYHAALASKATRVSVYLPFIRAAEPELGVLQRAGT